MKSESRRETGFRRKSGEISAATFPVKDLGKNGSQLGISEVFYHKVEVTPVIINFKLQNVTLAFLRMQFSFCLQNVSPGLKIRKRLVVAL